MIQLHQDYLFFETSSGETIPCSAELVAIELVGGEKSKLDPELVRQAAYAVLHYFKHDLGRNCVSVSDFSSALERVLTAFGVEVTSSVAENSNAEICDLHDMASRVAESIELAFFPQLRLELRRKIANSPDVLQFQGLRQCVKQMLGAKRWSQRCQALSDRIVEYLRDCLIHDHTAQSCGLVVR